jgi:hypothetical protein
MKPIRFRIIFLPLAILSAIPLTQYVVNTRYSFPEPQPFAGSQLYNPYRNLDPARWKMANFHAHTRCFGGITNGSNADRALDSCYRDFDFQVIEISNYQSIDNYEKGNKWFIPVYEHGYQYFKNHQLVINARKVSWLDYFLRQTLSNKQRVIDQLKKVKSVIVVLVHPVRRQAYSFNDLKYLGNYNLFEIADNIRPFTAYYDTILSAGHPVFLIANDDSHDLSRVTDAGHSFSIINSEADRDSILGAIRSGCLIGVDLNLRSCKTQAGKKSKLAGLPLLTGISVKNDTVRVSLDRSVRRISFIGQNGEIKKNISDTNAGSYPFGEGDTYIRTEIECRDSSVLFLNPVFRYNGTLAPAKLPAVNIPLTRTIRSFAIITILAYLFWRLNRYYRIKSGKAVDLYTKLKKSA